MSTQEIYEYLTQGLNEKDKKDIYEYLTEEPNVTEVTTVEFFDDYVCTYGVEQRGFRNC